MKYLQKKRSLLLLALCSVVWVTSCDMLAGDPDLPIPLDETLNNTGAFLRILSVESAGFDVADLSNAAFTFTGEISDVDNGATVETINFYTSYRPSTGDGVDEHDEPLKAYDASSLTTREESGLPGGQFSVTLREALDYLNLSVDQLSLGDVFNIRWEVVTEDGTTYSVDQASGAIGGGFYNSPYNANAGVVQSIPEDLFVGSYTIIQNNAGGTASFGPVFGNPFTVEFEVDPRNSLNGRIAEVSYLPEQGGFPRDLVLTFFRRQDFQNFTAADNWVSVPRSGLDLSLSCSAVGLSLGSVPDPDVTSFNIDDDSQFTFAVVDNENGDCGGSATVVTFTATKN